MNKPPVQAVIISEFKGQYSDADPQDVPDSTLWRQLNMLSIVNGQLTSRGGLKEVTLDILE